MRVKELREMLKTFDQDANVVVAGNGNGGSPFIDIDAKSYTWDGEPYQTEDFEPEESLSESTVYMDDESNRGYRKVVVLFSSEQLY